MSHTGHRSHGWKWDTENSMQQIASSQPVQSASPSQTTLANISRLSIHALVPPSTDARAILQRADEVNTIPPIYLAHARPKCHLARLPGRAHEGYQRGYAAGRFLTPEAQPPDRDTLQRAEPPGTTGRHFHRTRSIR